MKGSLAIEEFLTRVPDLVGGQVLYRKGPDFFCGLIQSAEIAPYPLGRLLKISTTWQAVQRVNGWHFREDKEVSFSIGDVLTGWVDDDDHIILTLKGKSVSTQFKFSLPGGMAMINPAKVRYLKI